MLDTDLVAFLQALEGSAAGDRVFTGDAVQGTRMPVVIVRRTSGLTPRTLGNVALFSRATFSIDCVGRSYEEAMPLATLVGTALDGFKGLMGLSKIQSCRRIADPADFSDVLAGDQVFRRLTQDFQFVYRP